MNVGRGLYLTLKVKISLCVPFITIVLLLNKCLILILNVINEMDISII
jgi:hypothetical protein